MENNLEPVITDEERKALYTVLALKELKEAKHHLVSARWCCSHMGNQSALEMYLKKILKDIKDMVKFLDGIYKNNKILYNRVQMLYNSMERVVEE